MKRKSFVTVVSALLILLFVYAAASKLLDYNSFRAQLQNQPLPLWSAAILVWALPAAEFIIAALLFFTVTRTAGLYASFLILLVFTVYIALVLAHTFGRIPCSCGGILKNMQWGTHLAFNIIFVLLALAGIVLQRKNYKML